MERRPTSEFHRKNPSLEKLLALDFCPAGRVDQEHEHVLLTAVQARCPVHPRLGRLEVRRKFLHDGQQIQIMEPGVARPMNGTNGPVQCFSTCIGLPPWGSVSAKTRPAVSGGQFVDRVFADTCELAQL